MSGHAACKEAKLNAQIILVGEAERKIPVGRSRHT